MPPALIDVLRSAPGLELLPITTVSTLVVRALTDVPDAIVIVTENLAHVSWRGSGDLTDVLSSTPSVLLASQVHRLLRKRATALHIRSVLPLDLSSDQLLAAIHATVAGLAVALEPLGQIEDEYTAWSSIDEIGEADKLVEHLTQRETLVLRLLALGLGNKEIASRLDISQHTAKFHVSSILAKLGAASRTEAVTIGIMRGLVTI